MVLVFDLDDTLYNEATYMQSGFKAVASYLESQLLLNRSEVYHRAIAIEREYGRGKVFDILLRELNQYSYQLKAKCVSVYRLHDPVISLNKDADRCLKRFKRLPLYIVLRIKDGR